MKKVLALMLALVLVLSLVACGGGEKTADETEAPTEPETLKYSLGEKVSTDIVDFTLKDARFSYFASSTSSTFGEPISKDGGTFAAAKGRVLVCLTFEIKNLDRNTLDVGSTISAWRLNFILGYKGENYYLRGYDLNNKDGDISGIDLYFSGVSDDGGSTWDVHSSTNEKIRAGQKTTFRVVTVAVVDPDSLDDPFEITVNVPSSAETEYFTYTVG